MVHFASVRPETLWLYNADTRKSELIYPPSQDPFRSAYSQRLAAIVDEDRCRSRNWSCDPREFTSSIGLPVVVNEATRAFAFQVTFETGGFLDREESENSGQWDDDNYVYVYRREPFGWREFSLYDLKPKFGTNSLKDLLSPDNIVKVFATPAPN
jgi:hypothetical protein